MSQNERPWQNKPLLNALGLAWQLGYTIAIPLVILALLGRLLDKYLNSSPLFLLAGVIMSIIVTTWLIYRKVKTIIPPAPAEGKTNKSTDHRAEL